MCPVVFLLPHCFVCPPESFDYGAIEILVAHTIIAVSNRFNGASIRCPVNLLRIKHCNPVSSLLS
jgi:hypothetical protein